VEIVFAPDDICAPLLENGECHCREASVYERDRMAAEALADLLGRPIAENSNVELSRDTLEIMREAFAAGTIRKACQGCQWSPLCDGIASGGFSKTSLRCGSPAPD
jgi:hypothetical protein